MVSGKPSNNKIFKHGKNFNLFLVLLCLLLVFLGKLDLIAIRNFKAFLSDFLAPITYALNKPVIWSFKGNKYYPKISDNNKKMLSSFHDSNYLIK